MSRTAWIRIVATIIIALTALLLVRTHFAAGESLPRASRASAGHRLAQAWCMECHSIEAHTPWTGKPAPDFAAIANQPSSTALSLKVFLQSNHRSMPNLIIAKSDTDDLVAYILSLKRN